MNEYGHKVALRFQWHTGCMAQATRTLSDVVVNDHAGRISQAVPYRAFLWFTSVIRVVFGVRDIRLTSSLRPHVHLLARRSNDYWWSHIIWVMKYEYGCKQYLACQVNQHGHILLLLRKRKNAPLVWYIMGTLRGLCQPQTRRHKSPMPSLPDHLLLRRS